MQTSKSKEYFVHRHFYLCPICKTNEYFVKLQVHLARKHNIRSKSGGSKRIRLMRSRRIIRKSKIENIEK